MNIFLEIGKKRTFACALEWPGWSRSGHDEPSALQALLDYTPRYARAVASTGMGFIAPQDVSAFTIIERLEGNAGTDFGAPSTPPAADANSVTETDVERLQALLQAIWGTFDSIVLAAEGRELRVGPRGGGRSLDKILSHVLEAEMAYLNRLGGNFKPQDSRAGPRLLFPVLRQAILETLGPAARGELPQVGPRGGKRWTARFYVRYAAWHLLDHAWEIEDRIIQ
jgi:hypothetical protein